MPNPTHHSLPAVLSVLAFGALSLVGGWLIVYGGGFFASSSKYSADAVFISGLPALFMALVQFSAATLAFMWVLRGYLSSTVSAVIALAMVWIPPILFALHAWPAT